MGNNPEDPKNKGELINNSYFEKVRKARLKQEQERAQQQSSSVLQTQAVDRNVTDFQEAVRTGLEYLKYNHKEIDLEIRAAKAGHLARVPIAKTIGYLSLAELTYEDTALGQYASQMNSKVHLQAGRLYALRRWLIDTYRDNSVQFVDTSEVIPQAVSAFSKPRKKEFKFKVVGTPDPVEPEVREKESRTIYLALSY